MATPRKKPEDRLKMGRPYLYRPEYCALVRKLGAKGGLTCTFAAEIGVSKECILNWGRVNPDFSEALADAKSASERYMVDLATKKAHGLNKNGDAGMIKFLLSAAHGYREKTDVTTDATVNLSGEIKLHWGDEEK